MNTKLLTTEQIDNFFTILKKLLALASKAGAVDLIIKPYSEPRLSFHFGVSKIDTGGNSVVSAEATIAILQRFLTDFGKEKEKNVANDDLKNSYSLAFSFENDEVEDSEKVRYRMKAVKTFPEGYTFNFRKIDTKGKTPTELGIPREVRSAFELKNGIILITGPVGAGKTTTVTSIIQELLNSKDIKIDSIEEPVEFVFTDNIGMAVQREVGNSVNNFGDGILDTNRTGPNILFLGEMGSAESVLGAIKAIGTGRLVASTLHSPTCAHSITRILEYFDNPGNKKYAAGILADNLHLIVNQRLIGINEKVINPKTGKEEIVQKPKVIFETVRPNQAIKEKIRDGEDVSSIQGEIDTAGPEFVNSLKNQLLDLYYNGKIDIMTLQQNSPNWKSIKDTLIENNMGFDFPENDLAFINAIE